jgi:hypothetical protein
MTPELTAALKQAAQEARCIDPDVVLALPIFAEIIAKVESETDAPGAIDAMRQARPKLFKQDEWSSLSPDQFAEAEKRLKERLARRTQPAARNNDFAKLDAALLSSEESNALRRFLGGTRNSFDASLLRAALARQQGTRGDAA